MPKELCCHLAQEPPIECAKDALWCLDIYGEPYMETYACNDHLAGMLEIERTNVVVYIGDL